MGKDVGTIDDKALGSTYCDIALAEHALFFSFSHAASVSASQAALEAKAKRQSASH